MDKSPEQLAHEAQLAIRQAEDGPFFDRVEMPGCAPPVMASGDWGAEANSLIWALSTRVSDLESDVATIRRNAKDRIAELEHHLDFWKDQVRVVLCDLTAARGRVAELEREIAAIMDYVEPHWKGAGVVPSADFIIKEFSSAYSRKDAEIERFTALLREAQGALAPFAKEGACIPRLQPDNSHYSHVSVLVGAFRTASALAARIEKEIG